MTEVGMALGNPIDGPRVPGEVGIPFPDVQVKLISEDKADVTSQTNVSGQLLVRGPQVFKEYWGKQEATAETFYNGTEWFKTGDIACRTERGTFKILGRASVDIIKTGGYKVSALDVEREILEHPLISDVAVVGVESEEWGQRIAAVVVLKDPKQSFTLDELRKFLASRLSTYKSPTRLSIVEELPKNAMGKVNKKQLAKSLVSSIDIKQ